MKSLSNHLNKSLEENNLKIRYHFSYDIMPESDFKYETIKEILELLKADIKERVCQSTLIFEIIYVYDNTIDAQKNEFLDELRKKIENNTYFIISEIISNETYHLIKNTNQDINNV